MERGKEYSAVDTFQSMRTMERFRKIAFKLWRDQNLTCLFVPTASTTPTIKDVLANPIGYNTVLGYYTNFVNLLDLCGMSVPAGFIESAGMPTGVQFLGAAWHDDLMYDFGRRFQRARNLPMGATGLPLPGSAKEKVWKRLPSLESAVVRVAVFGAHMQGLPLNKELIELGARFVSGGKTATKYTFYDISDSRVKRPGLVKSGSSAIELEVWELPTGAVGRFMSKLKAPLTIGQVELSDGKEVLGFLCEPYAADPARDISSYGGWRNFAAKK